MVRRQMMGKASNASDKCSIVRQKTPINEKSGPFDKRSFFRSVSAEASQEQLIKGEPRLSDLAPDLASRHRAASRTSSHKEESAADVNYLALTPEEPLLDYLSGDEIFVAEDSARYYNFQAIQRSRPRRHSIGTFVGNSTKNSPEEASKHLVDDHSLRHGSYPRKRCSRCSKSNLKAVTMDDILIVSSKQNEAALLWVKYFLNYFQQISNHASRRPLNVQYVGVEEFAEKTEHEREALLEKSSAAKLQIVVICPNFLEFISEHPNECSKLKHLLLADRVLALLLGTTDSDITEIHRMTIPTFFHWQRQAVGQDQDENFTKDFLAQAMTILSRIWKQQSTVMAQEKSCFSITPKKIRQGQNSVFILLQHPLQKEDIVKISVEKDETIYEVRSVKRRNPYILKFSVPEHLTEVTAIVNILVEKNGSIIGGRPLKCESKLKELEEILKSSNSPIEFMCQTLEFNPPDREHLDNWMVQGFQRNTPPHFNLLSNHESPFPAHLQFHKHSHEEFPTLLHFASKFGLEKLAMQLLECPGADAAYKIRNLHNMTPLEIAERNDHSALASVLRGYMNMNEFSSMYMKLKEMSVTPKTPDTANLSEFYKICPPPRPVEATPTTPTDWASSFGIQIPCTSRDNICDLRNSSLNLAKIQPEDLVPRFCTKSKQNNVVEDKVQKELVEIINDFKNNVHSIAQVEKLVEEWKNRNDVQRSFKEKQEQLMEMRVRYEQIQNDMRKAMKKPTPFERIKKMFTKQHKHDKTEASTSLLGASPTITITSSQRPISSLSTSSSASSGRMSTISGCSVGDSGTHSDNEEWKMFACHLDDDLRNKKTAMEMNYSAVPTPKPVKMFPTKNTFETIEEKPAVRPNNLPLVDEFYIHFPPSGMPVKGFKDCDNDANTSANNVHEYMNCKVPLSR